MATVQAAFGFCGEINDNGDYERCWLPTCAGCKHHVKVCNLCTKCHQTINDSRILMVATDGRTPTWCKCEPVVSDDWVVVPEIQEDVLISVCAGVSSDLMNNQPVVYQVTGEQVLPMNPHKGTVQEPVVEGPDGASYCDY